MFHHGSEARRWYAVRVRTGKEKAAAKSLSDSGIEVNLPTVQERRVWSDRTKAIHKALFPGYLFCRADASERQPILAMPSVIEIVGRRKEPLPIDDDIISAIDLMVQSRSQIRSHEFLSSGELVELEAGPMRGLRGFLVKEKSEHRLVVSVLLLQRSIAVEVERQWVRPLPEE